MNKLPLVTHKRKSVKHVNSTDITTESGDKERSYYLLLHWQISVAEENPVTKDNKKKRLFDSFKYNSVIAAL